MVMCHTLCTYFKYPPFHPLNIGRWCIICLNRTPRIILAFLLQIKSIDGVMDAGALIANYGNIHK